MLKVCSVILEVIAGFFIYLLTLVAFMTLPATWKVGIVIGCALPALLSLAGGLALMRFRYWKRDAGVVLLTVAGFTAFSVFSMACMFMSAEFRAVMPMDGLRAFGSYFAGSGCIAGLAVVGWLLVKADGSLGMQPQQSS